MGLSAASPAAPVVPPPPPPPPNPAQQMGQAASMAQKQRAMAGAGFAGTLTNSGGAMGQTGAVPTTGKSLTGT